MINLKFRIFFRPAVAISLLILVTSALSAFVASRSGALRFFLVVAAVVFAMLSIVSLYAVARILRIEKPFTLSVPQRLLILAPHQDDCVICAGGLGILTLDPHFHVPDQGVMGIFYRRLGFRNPESILRFRRAILGVAKLV